MSGGGDETGDTAWGKTETIVGFGSLAGNGATAFGGGGQPDRGVDIMPVANNKNASTDPTDGCLLVSNHTRAARMPVSVIAWTNQL
jgi:hypothetical protein